MLLVVGLVLHWLGPGESQIMWGVFRCKLGSKGKCFRKISDVPSFPSSLQHMQAALHFVRATERSTEGTRNASEWLSSRPADLTLSSGNAIANLFPAHGTDRMVREAGRPKKGGMTFFLNE